MTTEQSPSRTGTQSGSHFHYKLTFPLTRSTQHIYFFKSSQWTEHLSSVCIHVHNHYRGTKENVDLVWTPPSNHGVLHIHQSQVLQLVNDCC